MFTALVETLTTFGSLLAIIVTLVFLAAVYKRDNSLMDIAYGPIFLGTSLGTLLINNRISALSLLILLSITLWSLRLAFRIYRKNKGKPEDQCGLTYESMADYQLENIFLARNEKEYRAYMAKTNYFIPGPPGK